MRNSRNSCTRSSLMKAIIVALSYVLSVLVIHRIFHILIRKQCTIDLPCILSNNFFTIISLFIILISFILYSCSMYTREIKYRYNMTNLICHRSEKRSEANTPTDATKKLSFDSTETKPGDPRPTELALATLFLTACVTPKEICTCIDERVKTDTRSLRVKSNISFKVPFNFQDSSVVVPVLFYRRCDFPDALSVTNLSGYDASCLNLRETIQYIADVVYVCLPELKETRNENLSKRIRSFIEAGYSLSDADIEDREKEYSDICEAMGKTCGRDRELKARWQVVASFFELLVEGYPICLRCDTGSSKDWQLQYDEKHKLRYQASRARTVSVLLEYRIPLAYEKGRWPLRSKTEKKLCTT